MKGQGKSSKPKSTRKSRRVVVTSSPKVNSASKKSIKLRSSKTHDGVSQDSLNVSITIPDDEDEDCFEIDFENFYDEQENEEEICDFDDQEEEALLFEEDYDETKLAGTSIKLNGVQEVRNRGEIDTIFKCMDDYKRSNVVYKEHEEKEDWDTCISLLYTHFVNNLKNYRPGIFLASYVGTCIRGYNRWVQFNTPFCHTNIKSMMDNSWKASQYRGPFEVKCATLRYDPSPIPAYRPKTLTNPQQLGIDMEPYMRKLLERKLLEDTGNEWEVMESGSMMSDDGLCLSKSDGFAVMKSNPKEKVLVELKYVLPFKNIPNFQSISPGATTSLPIVKSHDGEKCHLNTNHLYGHQVRLSLSITKLKKALVVFGLEGLHDDTENMDKIEYVEFNETSDYLDENKTVLHNIVKEIIVPLMVHDKINFKGDPSSSYSEEVKYCVRCDKNIKISGWSDRSHLSRHRICGTCKLDCVSTKCLEIHRHEKHGEESSYKCEFCKKLLVTFDSYRVHQVIHSVKKYKCDHSLCDRTFYSLHDLQKHKLSHLPKDHPDRVQWTCPSCHKSVDLYLQNVHTNYCYQYRQDNGLPPPNLTCSGCQNVLPSYTQFTEHRRKCVPFIKTTLTPAELLLDEQQQNNIIQKKIDSHKWTCLCGLKFARDKRGNHMSKCVVYQANHPTLKVHFKCEGCGSTTSIRNKGRHIAACEAYIKLDLTRKGQQLTSEENTKDLVQELKDSKKKECQFCQKRYVDSGKASKTGLPGKSSNGIDR